MVKFMEMGGGLESRGVRSYYLMGTEFQLGKMKRVVGRW
jgi:hypothetical protein